MPHHHGPVGSRIDCGENCGDLVGERRRCVAVALARQGDWYGAVAAGLQLGGHVIPDRPVEPQAREQHDVHVSSPSSVRYVLGAIGELSSPPR
jgi:hypothetical protein